MLRKYDQLDAGHLREQVNKSPKQVFQSHLEETVLV